MKDRNSNWDLQNDERRNNVWRNEERKKWTKEEGNVVKNMVKEKEGRSKRLKGKNKRTRCSKTLP